MKKASDKRRSRTISISDNEIKQVHAIAPGASGLTEAVHMMIARFAEPDKPTEAIRLPHTVSLSPMEVVHIMGQAPNASTLSEAIRSATGCVAGPE